MTSRSSRRLAALAVVVLALAASPVAAATPLPDAVPSIPLFAGYWQEFLDYWVGALKKQNGIIMVALGLAATSLFIITRGKWRK